MMYRSAAVFLLLVLLQSCSDITNAPLQESAATSSSEYFWPGSATTFDMWFGFNLGQYWRVQDSAGLHVLTDGTHRLVVSSASGKTLLTGIDARSLIDLDPGMYFSADDSVHAIMNTPRCAQYVESDGSLYVGCDSGVFVRTTGTSYFRFAGLAGSATAIAMNASKHTLLVGMTNGSLWSGADGTWTSFPINGLPKGAIQTIAITPTQEIYCAVTGQPGFYKYSDASGWTLVSYMSTSSVAILHPFFTSSPKLQKVIAVATSAGEVGILNLDGYTNPDPRKIADRISGFSSGEAGALLAATNAGILLGDVHPNTWTNLATPITANATAIHSWYSQSASPSLFYATPGSVENTSLGGASLQTFSNYGLNNVFALGHFDQALYAITPHGCLEYQGSWIAIPGLAGSYFTRNEGPLVLLQDPLRVSSSWDAGRLVTDRHQTYPITARVLEHLDTLHVGTRRYPDVFMVRYADEHPDLTAERAAIPYWVLYFARDIGLVLSEKVVGDSIVSRQTRQ